MNIELEERRNRVHAKTLSRKEDAKEFLNIEICPNCGSPRVKTWDELDRDEKIVAERLPDAAEFTHVEIEKHRFCTRCWFKMKQVRDELA